MTSMLGNLARRVCNLAAVPSTLRQVKAGLEQLAAGVRRIEAGGSNLDPGLAQRWETFAVRQRDALRLDVRNILEDPALAFPAGARLEAAAEDLAVQLGRMAGAQAGTAAAIEMLRQATATIRQELAATRQQVADLQRTAAARGNVLLPGNRLLTRISLPQYFLQYDPILFVNADDKLIVPKLAMHGYYELESSHFVARSIKPNDHVVDVGANFGYYTAMMGLLVSWKGKVVAFEPQPEMAVLLQENTLINWIEPWVKIVRAACSEAPGTMRLFTSRARAANTGLAVPEIAAGYGADFAFTPIEVPAVAVDDSLDFLEGRVDFMKIDVEGAEPMVLRGARRTIAANPGIRILMEWSPDQLHAAGSSPDSFVDELKAMGLACFSLHGPGQLGDVTPMEHDQLRTAGYQNIVLMRAH